MQLAIWEYELPLRKNHLHHFRFLLRGSWDEHVSRALGNMADEAELSSLTFAEIKKLKVTELKVRLSSLGLPVSGMHFILFVNVLFV